MSVTVAREPRRNRQFWLMHIQQWTESGLSKADYCKHHHLKPASFYNWASKEAVATEQRSLPAPSRAAVNFLPVAIRDSTSSDTPRVRVQRAATEVSGCQFPRQWSHFVFGLMRPLGFRVNPTTLFPG